MSKILLIDDDPTILTMFKMALSKAGLDVLTASNGQEGLRVIREDNPDLAVVDIAMPGLDGYEVIRQLRELAEAEDADPLPIIVLTAHEQDVMREYAKEVGADMYLTKPIAPSDLIQHVESLL